MISTTMKRSAAGITAAATYAITNFQFASAAAADCSPDVSGAVNGAACAAPSSAVSGLTVGGLFGTIANILIFLVGAISVIVLIIGGLRYVISAGNPAQVTGAKNTILYAIVGIVISIAAYAIVQFVFKSLGVTS